MLSLVSFIISIVSFVLTTVTVVFTYRFNRITIRNSAKQEHQKMLLDINKMLLAEPVLWAVYDDHPMSMEIDLTPEMQAKLDALIYYYLNFFDVVYEFYNIHIIPNKNDKETWKSWKAYIRKFISGSARSRELIKQSGSLYEEGVYGFYHEIINEVEAQAA